MRVEKALVLFAVITILGVFLISFSSAVFDCADNQTIVRLSSATNAHGALWNISTYTTKICYESIFGQNYTFTAVENPHLCKDNKNLVVKLSGDTNAHAGDTASSYSKNICYGNLICRSTTGSCNSVSEKLIVSLSGSTNAHLANDNSYGLKICCSNGQVVVEVCNNNGVCNSDSGEGCGCEDCAGEHDSCPGENQICNAFTDSPECVEYESPSIAIIKPTVADDPANWPKYKVGETVSFEQVSKGTRDLNVTWNFGNGTSKTFTDCLTGGNCNTTGKYTQQAHYTITAKATEKKYSENYAVNKTEILVYKEGINVFAIISRPSFNEQIGGGEPVYFNGNRSFAANCSLTCAVGKECYNVGAQNPLKCFNFEIPPQSYNFWFNWTITRLNPEPAHENIVGKWNDGYTSYVEFNHLVGRPGNYFVSLKVGYEKI
jgi:hypothetical protein